MKNNQFFSEVFKKYSDINFPEEYKSVVDIKTISWYLSDELRGIVSYNNDYKSKIFEIDVKSAFPTICINIFGEESEFIQKLNSIENKRSKNIFIATYFEDKSILKQLNIISKMIITGAVFSIDETAQLLELKKDGIVFISNETSVWNSVYEYADEKVISLNPFTININEYNSQEFISFISDKNFRFHITNYNKYLRANRTSFFVDKNNNFKFKGFYKYLPEFLKEQIQEFINTEQFNKTELLDKYSSKYWKIIFLNRLDELIKYYYICENDKFLSFDGKYLPINDILKNNSLIDPRFYLKTFIFPILSFLR